MLFILIGFDRLLFEQAIFWPRNYSGWDSFRWYNFEHHNRRLQKLRRVDSRTPLILIVGSSIARYAVQTHILEALILARTGRRVHVRNYTHAALQPADLYFYQNRIAALNPDLIVYLTNPADLDLERYSQPWQAAPDYVDTAAFRFLSQRHPGQLLYPGAFAAEFGLRAGIDDWLSRQLYASFASLRMREQWWEPLRFSMQSAARPQKSYLNYQGIRIAQGLWREGHSISCLSFPARALAGRQGGQFFFEVPPDLAGPDLYIEFYKVNQVVEAHAPLLDYLYQPSAHVLNPGLAADLQKNYRQLLEFAPIDCRPPGAEPDLRYQARSGWQKVALPMVSDLSSMDHHQKPVHVLVRLSHVIDPVSGTRLKVGQMNFRIGKGIRLPGFFGLNRLPEDDYFVRRRDWESRRLMQLDLAQSQADFLQRMEPVDWRDNQAVRQLNFVRLGKYYTNFYDFDASRMLQARFMRNLVGNWRTYAPVVLVNNAENPLTRLDYADEGRVQSIEQGRMQGPMQKISSWYAGYLEFMAQLCARDKKLKNCHLADFRASMPANFFSDTHHLTYEGMLRMAPHYAFLIQRAMHQNLNR